MPWFYAREGRQLGPVPDAEFENLVRDGTVQSSTPVWREGMSEWRPYADLNGICALCRKQFPGDALVHIEGATVCVGCKPIHLQRLREGASPTAGPPTHQFAGFWIRGLATFIDGVILFVFSLGISLMTGMTFTEYFGLNSGTETAFWSREDTARLGLDILIGTVYETVLVTVFGGTLGKLICRLRVITAGGHRLSLGHSLGRSLAEWLTILPCGTGYVLAAFDKEKRALHDLICNTRVIRAERK